MKPDKKLAAVIRLQAFCRALFDSESPIHACKIKKIFDGAMQAADSCTSLRIKTGDGLVFYARTMEFGNFKSSVSVVPGR